MNGFIFRSLQGALSSLVKKVVTPTIIQSVESRGLHQLCRQFNPVMSIISPSLTATTQNIFKPSTFLAPILPQLNQVCGMKQKGVLQLRCKSCYLVQRQGRMYVNCKAKPKHKQMQMTKSWKKRRILTFAHQKKEREW